MKVVGPLQIAMKGASSKRPLNKNEINAKIPSVEVYARKTTTAKWLMLMS